jgi:toxin ParE1/3/4
MLPLARQEMLRAARWYDARAKGTGDRFLDSVRDGLLSIKEFPGAAPSIGDPYRRKIISDFPYGLVFHIEGDGVEIIAVAHLKRRPRYWERRRSSR